MDEDIVMLLLLKVTTTDNTELTTYWTIPRTPLPWEVKMEAKKLCSKHGRTYRRHSVKVSQK